MGLSTEHGAVDGYEAVELLPAPAEPGSGSAAMLRRRSARSSRRAVLYVHCLTDSFVPESLASWYSERGFHFYVADLRPSARPDQPADEQGAGPDLRGCTGALDVMARHLRESEAIDTVVVSAHATGALIAALWCDASPAEALILADPAFGTGRRRHLGQDTGLAKGSGSGKGADPDEAGPAPGRRPAGPRPPAPRRRRGGTGSRPSPARTARQCPAAVAARPGHLLPGAGDVHRGRLGRPRRRAARAAARAPARRRPWHHPARPSRHLAAARRRAGRPAAAAGSRGQAVLRRAWALAGRLPGRAVPRSAALRAATNCPRHPRPECDQALSALAPATPRPWHAAWAQLRLVEDHPNARIAARPVGRRLCLQRGLGIAGLFRCPGLQKVGARGRIPA